MTLYLFNFNNYYNRIVKKYDTIEEYGEPLDIIERVNFIPNNGISAEQIINYDGDHPDYLVLTDEDDKIISRWYIIDSNRTRGGQFKLTLYRDVIADWYQEIVKAPCFIEKATLDIGDPLLFNNENMTYNQIKKAEFLLKDKSNCPWIIGYYSKNTPTENLKGSINRNNLNNVFDIEINSTFSSWKYNATTTPFKLTPDEVEYRIYTKNRGHYIITNEIGYLKFNKNGSYTGYEISYKDDVPLYTKGVYNWLIVGDDTEPFMEERSKILYGYLKNYVTMTTDEDSNYFLNLNGKTIKDSEGKFYYVTISKTDSITDEVNIGGGNLFNELSTVVSNSPTLLGTPNTTSFQVALTSTAYLMTAVELSNLATNWDMSGERLTTEDSPYNIFAIPYGTVELYLDDYLIAVSSPDVSMAAATSIINTMQPSTSGGFLYDIQLLPYCPIEFETEGKLNCKSVLNYSVIEEPNESGATTVGFILNIPNSQFTKNIKFEIDVPIDAVELKVMNECDKYRLSSPNFGSYFDFSVAKNNGVSYFNIDCTYKPYQPYIHINPDFKNLYGGDFNDPRGLILNGDFSLAQISNAWETYQIQNKNFSNIFDRQIDNMNINNSIQRNLEIGNAITGSISGGATLGMSGAMTAGSGGGAIGAALGTATSLTGGLFDLMFNNQLRNEALDFTKDLFGYSLGNVQALPYTLTKVSSFNFNNKIFPIIEYYTCTDREKDALRDKLKYNGMTVMAIGKINDYKQNKRTYIKCGLIRLENIKEDFHIINQIANELNKGVFI